MTLYQVLRELQIVLVLILGACPAPCAASPSPSIASPPPSLEPNKVLLGLLTHQAVYAASAFGMAACSLGVTLGDASIASVVMPYAVPQRRSSAFGGAGTGRGCLAGLSNVVILVLAVVFLSPVLVMLLYWQAGLWLLAVGPGYGAALAWAGRLIASEIGFRRLPELLAEVSRPI